MELFGSYTSPYVRHCRIVLMQLGQPFTFVETDYDKSAKSSPTKRVPYLRDGDRFLSDSSTILQYVRSKAGQPFLADIEDAGRFHLVNAGLESAVNVFLLEKDGITAAQSSYLQRQVSRSRSVLEVLEGSHLEIQGNGSDSVIRAACFLGWALFRKRFDLVPYPNLAAFVARAERLPHFTETAPPGG